MRDRVVGTCGNCGGRVLNYSVLHMVGPWPPGVCESCGAEEASHGPVLPMNPARPTRDCYGTGENSNSLRGWTSAP